MNVTTQFSLWLRWRARLASTLFLIVVVGCGGPANKYDAQVTGTVTIAGELAPSGTIVFHPVDKTGKIAVGRIYPDGSFSLRTGQGDLREGDGGTVVPGEYIVTVVVTGPPPAPTTAGGGPPIAGPLLIAEKYINRDTSDLKQTIQGGENLLSFELEPAAPADADTDAEGESAEASETDAAAPTTDEPAAVPADAPPSAAPANETSAPPVEGAQQ